MVDQSAIKSIYQCNMLSFYRDCVFDCVKWKFYTVEFVSCALCIVWIARFSHSEAPTKVLKLFIYFNQSLVKTCMLLMIVVLDRWPIF
jgi:hypothetical protein